MSHTSAHTTAADAERDRLAFALAKQFLLGLPSVTEDILRRYTVPPTRTRPATIEGVYEQLLVSAQDKRMSTNVIGGAIGGVSKLGPLLGDFSPQEVLARYAGEPERLLERIVAHLRPRGQVRLTSRSMWPSFCRTILSGASFMLGFESADAFYGWVDFFDDDDRARAALPMLLSFEVEGLGFALACMFLMELGYTKFAKPDVHLKAIFKALHLSRTDGDYDVFKAIIRVAENARVTPFHLDKLFWLIGSGDFYLDAGIKAGRNRDRFIAYAQPILCKGVI